MVLWQHLVKCNCVRAVVGLVEQGKDLAGFVMPMVCCHGFIFLILFTFLSLQEIKFSHNPHLSLSVDDWDVWMFLGRFPFEKKNVFLVFFMLMTVRKISWLGHLEVLFLEIMSLGAILPLWPLTTFQIDQVSLVSLKGLVQGAENPVIFFRVRS